MVTESWLFWRQTWWGRPRCLLPSSHITPHDCLCHERETWVVGSAVCCSAEACLFHIFPLIYRQTRQDSLSTSS